MIPGDGIGPEMMNYVKEVFTIAGVPVDFEIISFDPLSENDNDLKQVRFCLVSFEEANIIENSD
jgi:isocitrate/isopropylmalate dehydrogenase